MKATTQQWLDFARTDLHSCINNINDDFVTNLIRLYSFAVQFLIEPLILLELDALDDVYTSSRYPGDIGMMASGKPSLTESKELFESAKRVFGIIVRSIES